MKYITVPSAGAAICLSEEKFPVIGGEGVLECLMFPSQFRLILDILDPMDFALIMGLARLGWHLKDW